MKANLFSHVGILVKSCDEAAKQWEARFGFQLVEEIVSEVEGVRSLFLALPGGGEQAARVELVEPLRPDDPANPISRRLAEKGEGFFQLALRVDDPAGHGKELRAMGLKVFDAPPFREGEPPRAIVHPGGANGVLVELM
ncbi:MAG: VOC family protein [Sphingobium sp.]